MKNIVYATMLAFIITFGATSLRAQAWEKNTKVLALGFGVSQFFHVDNYYYGHYPNGHPKKFRSWYWPMTGQINFQGEFGIHKYVGLGFTTGIGGRGGLLFGYAGEVNVPIGMIVNFHFYQLIADRASKNIHADKLDIYAGINFGGGIAAAFYPNLDRIVPIAFGGAQVGVRYYFKPKVGLNAELGFGKSLANVGFVFKL